ncbi:hypothetical protein BDR07DRAFT_1417762 [Suillus spraguei]|nr:hypothetical protein BDR07DRAFT_1417762 [Suillus spraguei]
MLGLKANHLLPHFIGKSNPCTRDDSHRNYLVITFSRGTDMASCDKRLTRARRRVY